MSQFYDYFIQAKNKLHLLRVLIYHLEFGTNYVKFQSSYISFFSFSLFFILIMTSMTIYFILRFYSSSAIFPL